MLEEKKNMELPTAVPTTRIRSYRTAIFIAVLALVVSLSANFFNYLFTNSVRTDIQKQKLELDKFQANIELVTSNMRKKIDDDRLLLDAQIASSAEKFEKQRIQIESQHGRTEKIHRTMSFTKLFKDLRPTIEIDCQRGKIYTVKISKNTIPVDCSFKNLGTLKANITPVTLIMIGGEDYKDIDGAIERIDNNEENSILPGKISASRYYVVLTENGATNLRKASFKIGFQAFTDAAAIGAIKQRTKETITDEELKKLSGQVYTFTFQL
jgi:hypothetical protein